MKLTHLGTLALGGAGVISMEELARPFHGSELAPMTSTDMAHLLSDRLDDLPEDSR